jgi:hypothetical protein
VDSRKDSLVYMVILFLTGMHGALALQLWMFRSVMPGNLWIRETLLTGK